MSREFTIRIPMGDKQEFVTVPSSTRVALQRWIDYTDLQRWSTSRPQPQPILPSQLPGSRAHLRLFGERKPASQGIACVVEKRSRNDRCASYVKTCISYDTFSFGELRMTIDYCVSAWQIDHIRQELIKSHDILEIVRSVYDVLVFSFWNRIKTIQLYYCTSNVTMFYDDYNNYETPITANYN